MFLFLDSSLARERVLEKKKAQVDEQLDMGVAHVCMPEHRTENLIIGLIIQQPFLFQASNSSTTKSIIILLIDRRFSLTLTYIYTTPESSDYTANDFHKK